MSGFRHGVGSSQRCFWALSLETQALKCNGFWNGLICSSNKVVLSVGSRKSNIMRTMTSSSGLFSVAAQPVSHELVPNKDLYQDAPVIEVRTTTELLRDAALLTKESGVSPALFYETLNQLEYVTHTLSLDEMLQLLACLERAARRSLHFMNTHHAHHHIPAAGVRSYAVNFDDITLWLWYPYVKPGVVGRLEELLYAAETFPDSSVAFLSQRSAPPNKPLVFMSPEASFPALAAAAECLGLDSLVLTRPILRWAEKRLLSAATMLEARSIAVETLSYMATAYETRWMRRYLARVNIASPLSEGSTLAFLEKHLCPYYWRRSAALNVKALYKSSPLGGDELYAVATVLEMALLTQESGEGRVTRRVRVAGVTALRRLCMLLQNKPEDCRKKFAIAGDANNLELTVKETTSTTHFCALLRSALTVTLFIEWLSTNRGRHYTQGFSFRGALANGSIFKALDTVATKIRQSPVDRLHPVQQQPWRVTSWRLLETLQRLDKFESRPLFSLLSQWRPEELAEGARSDRATQRAERSLR